MFVHAADTYLITSQLIDTVSAASNKALGNEETGSVAVEYLNEERTEAEITYLIHAEPKEPVNVIFFGRRVRYR